MTQTRVHAGVPTGGQFCASTRPEADITLDAGRSVFVNLPNSDGVVRRISTDEAAQSLWVGGTYTQTNVFEGIEDTRHSHRVTVNRVSDRGVDITYPNGNGGGPWMGSGYSYAADQDGTVYLLDADDQPFITYRPAA